MTNELFSYLLYEEVSEHRLQLSLNDYELFLKNIIKFSSIITEDKYLAIDVPNEAIQLLLENDHKFINGEEFKKTFKNSKHWQNLKNLNFNQIFFAIFNFSDDNEIDQFHYLLQKIDDDLYLKKARNIFKNSCLGINSFYGQINNTHVICLNKISKNPINNLYHEISHFIQNIAKIRLIKVDKKLYQHLDENDINEFFEYISSKEFWATIDDIAISLKNMRNLTYSELSFYEFFEIVKNYLKECKKQNKLINNEVFINFIKANKNDYYPLKVLVYSYLTKFKFQKIWKAIEKFVINHEKLT
jgi:hypothetical protein